MTEPLPQGVHLLGLGRRAFLAGGGHAPDYVTKEKQGVLRLQNLAQPHSSAKALTVDVSKIFRCAFESWHFKTGGMFLC